MKKIVIILVCGILFFFISCASRKHKIDFSILERNAEKYPLYCLDETDSLMENSDLNQSDMMHLKLLRLQSKDKLDMNISTSGDIVEIQHIIDYYKKNRNLGFLKKSFYYGGRIYAELHDAPQALSYYNSALEVNASNVDLESKLYSQMGYLYFYQNLYAPALECFNKAYRLACLSKDTMKIVNSLKDMAYVDQSLLNYKKSIIILQKALKLCKNSCPARKKNSVVSYLAMAYNKLGDYQKAHDIIQPALLNLHSSDTCAVYSLYAEILYNLKNDSATYFFEYNAKNGNIYAKATAYSFLTENAINEGDVKLAKQFLQMYFKARETVDKFTCSETLAKANKLYNYQQKLKERDNAEKQKGKVMFISCTTVSVLIIILLLCIIFIKKISNRAKLSQRHYAQLKIIQDGLLHKKEAELEQIKFKISSLEQQLCTMDSRNKLLEEELSSEKELLQKKALLYSFTKQERELAMGKLRETEIVKKIYTLKKYESKEHLSISDKKDLITVFESYLPKFVENLYSLYDISNHELLVCLLLKLEIKPSYICVLLGTTVSSISKIRSRLYQKVFHKKESAEKWDNFILSL